MRKILLVVNPVLQQTRARRKGLARVLHVFEGASTTVEVFETGPDRTAGIRASQAEVDGFDAIVVCGGDGTVFDVIQGMAGSCVPLGIIPFGTGNVLAQNLRIPADPAAAAQSLLRSRPLSVPLGRISCCAPNERKHYLFAMSAGLGLHADLMSEARRSGKNVAGRAAYFAAGARLLLNHPVQPFEIESTDTSGACIREQVSEAIVVQVAELNRWRPGGGLELPYMRLATVPGASRSRLARATYEALFRGAGSRGHDENSGAAAHYRDVLRVVCRPISQRVYKPRLAIQADGEVLGESCADIAMSGERVLFLSCNPQIGLDPQPFLRN